MEERLPEGWTLAKVSDIADVIEPGFPHGRYNTEGIGIPHLRPMNIDGHGRLSLDEIKYVNVDNPPLLHSGDILFNNTNSPVWVGKTTIITQDEQYTFSNHMTRLTLNPHAGSPQFFALQLQYMQQSGYFLERCVHHVNQASIASSYLAKNVDISVAPAPEQSRIVAAIEQQFTRLDSAVASLQSAKAKAKQYRASLLKSAVEGELTKEWRAAHPAEETGAQLLARILAERRVRWEEEQVVKMREKRVVPKDDKWKQAYKEPRGPNVAQLPGLPEGWCWARAEQLCDFLTKGTTPAVGKLYSETGDIPFIKVYNLTPNGSLDFSVNPTFVDKHTHTHELARSKVFPGDILMNIVGPPLGKVAIVPATYPEWNINQAIAVFRPMPSYNKNFLVISLLTEHILVWAIRREKTTAGQHNLTLEVCRDLPLPLPPLAEQKQIVAEVEARLSNIAQMEATIEASLKRAEHERQAILREAFAGRLVPQDGNDEPASVLLERIREERKKREEAEKIARVNKKGIQMEITKKRSAGKTSLYTTLVEAGGQLPPDGLFKLVGLKKDEQPESVEVFYEKLHADVEDALIEETRPDDAHILLEALEPSPEILARMAVATQAQEAAQSEETIDAPKLWNI